MASDNDAVPRELSRQHIYELVWQRPMIHVARELGLSDQGLAKLCKREEIPRPPQGYWNKLAAGKPVGAIPPLPVGPRGHDAIVLHKSASSSESDSPKSQVEQLKAQLSDIRVSKRLANPHPVVAKHLAAREEDIRKGREYYDRIARVMKKVGPLDSADRRRLRILDTICKSLEAHGITIEGDNGDEVTARSGLDDIAFRLRYRSKQIQIPISPDDWRWQFKGKDAVRHELEATDDLILEINGWMPAGFRKSWRESAKRRLEELAGDIVATMLAAFPVLRGIREEGEEKARLREIEEGKRREREARQRLDRNRFRRLAEHAEAWSEASLVRSFVAALRNAELDQDAMIDDMTAAQWLDWADAAVARHDPLADPTNVLRSVAAVQSWTSSDR